MPTAKICLDVFHIVKWCTEALDEVRRETWNEARRGGMRAHARDLKGARYALWKNPEDLTVRQKAKLAWVATVNRRLYRAYLLKEQLRAVIALKGVRGLVMLDRWLGWTARCRIPAFVELGRRIRKNSGIEAALLHNLSNVLVESTNTKLRVLTRVAYGFREPEHLIALALLDRGGYCPSLPGRPRLPGGDEQAAGGRSGAGADGEGLEQAVAQQPGGGCPRQLDHRSRRHHSIDPPGVATGEHGPGQRLTSGR